MTEVLLFSPGNGGTDQPQVILTILDIVGIELISQMRKISFFQETDKTLFDFTFFKVSSTCEF